MPLYEKTHSWGEFVFDWGWAQAYHRLGIEYYPKLVSAAPFTPAPSPRLLLRNRNDQACARILIEAAVDLARTSGCSSLHVLFPEEAELEILRNAGLKLRKDCQFHWHNRNYRSFDEFLATFSSAKRKKARRDRRRVKEQDIGFRWLKGRDIGDALWSDVYSLISATFLRRGSMPYYNDEFFLSVSRALPDNVLVILAERKGAAVAAAVCYESDDALYGRYWGSDSHYDALHFETCYYQGIDYCIANGLARFEPGTQGEHKISRGFAPVATWSAHWLARPEFFSAVGQYLEEERRHVERYMDAVSDHSPYREEPPGKSQRLDTDATAETPAQVAHPK
jgi:predicted N-acyltransferase